MNRFLKFMFPLLLFCNFSKQLYSQDIDKDWLKKEFEITKQLIVMIIAQSDGAQEFGAGIIVGRKKDELLIATAYHILHNGNDQADKIQVQFRTKSRTYIEATLVKYSDEPSMDLALISVKNLFKHGIDVCSIQFDRLGNTTKFEQGDGVFPLGNPNGTPWAMPVVPDRVADVLDDHISFQSSFISKGNSGGALLDETSGIIGMVTADHPPFGRAINVESVIKKISQWEFQTHLHTNDNGLTLLHKAAKKANIIELKKLIEECGNVNQRDNLGQTPLHFAAVNENSEGTRILLNSGADVNLVDGYKFSALKLALLTGKSENVKLLVNAEASLEGWNSTFISVIRGDLGKLKRNLSEINNINQRDAEGATVLHYAAIYSNHDVLSHLINEGADVNAIDKYDETPLSKAILHGTVENVKFLIEAGANVNLSLVAVPFLELAIRKRRLEMIKVLLDAGAEVNSKSWNEIPPLSLAVFLGEVQIVKLLIDSGADVNQDYENSYISVQSPLGLLFESELSESDIIEIMEILVSEGADVNFSKGGRSPFLEVLKRIRKFSLETIEFLVLNGAEYNGVRLMDEYLPLIIAIKDGDKAGAEKEYQFLRNNAMSESDFLIERRKKISEIKRVFILEEGDWFICGYAFFKQNSIYDAIELVKLFVSNFPAEWFGYYHLGRFNEMSENQIEAISNYKIALSKAPEEERGRINGILKKLEAN